MTEDDPRAAGRRAAHGQAAYPVRLETGPTGAAAVVAGLGADDVAVVVDVLSFTTTLALAVERGVEVHPFAWRDERAEAYARERDAVLAVGRFEAAAAAPVVEERAAPPVVEERAQRASRDRPTLSPAAMLRGDGLVGVQRLVLPSPNGSTISALLADAGVGVVGACLRNASAVAEALAPALLRGASLAVVAAGERWPDGSLRPAVEDVWGAGSLLTALVGRGVTGLSPEAELAVVAWRTVADDPAAALRSCAGGRELAAVGFGADVEVAAAVDVSAAVPVLRDGAFRDAGTSSGPGPA
ncbi:2-phosphosulfolactate phosphatase [Nocardioides sp. AX2bis]|uniref:2-phosphosulfolactate phosphatase n=1 Tax=Nocardioides sp. AX2bis TaxID=2653157 RepID=UPI0012EF43A6|nr:2-phosphosulfolactate phosphatase [Nocardioides sp. AX2bis]VXC39951.1 2-phosphosulfolactate phosphatase [Nocardioides sp. AX2bis]